MSDVIDYVTIASAADASDFGDLSAARNGVRGTSNPTRGVFLGGGAPGDVNIIEYITIGSTGNVTDFGDLIAATKRGMANSDSHGGL